MHTPSSPTDAPRSLLNTGISGLDDILGGGLQSRRLYLVEGIPGSGKTTLCLQFLMAGRPCGEKGLYAALSETREELDASAAAHGWSLEGLSVWEPPGGSPGEPTQQTSMFYSSEVELDAFTQSLTAEIERAQPQRIVIDSLSELRLLAVSALRHRRQLMAFKRFAAGLGATVLVVDDRPGETTDPYLHTSAHGVITLDRVSPDFGAMRRRLNIPKMRGTDYRGGWHDFVIHRGGLEIFPRLIAMEHPTKFESLDVSSGVESLDRLFGGGVAAGTSTLVMGPAGAGKSTLATQFMLAAAERGEGAVAFMFDESPRTLLTRASSLEMEIAPHVRESRIRLHQIDPAQLTPGEFVSLVRHEVEDRAPAVTVLVIDSLNGYLRAVPEEHYLLNHLHEFLSYLGERGIATLVIVGQHGMVGNPQAPLDTSYLADNVILLRPFEAAGEVRHSVAMLKKRTGPHERAIREFRFGPKGIDAGEPLTQFHGILTGEPVFTGSLASANQR